MTLLRLTEGCGWQGGCPALFTRPGGGFVVQGPVVEGQQLGTGETAVEVPGSILLEIAAGQDHPMSLEEFGALFGSFRHSAFRLETLSRYAVDVEEEPFRRFVSGQPLPPMREWEAGRPSLRRSWRAIVLIVRGKSPQRSRSSGPRRGGIWRWPDDARVTRNRIFCTNDDR